MNIQVMDIAFVYNYIQYKYYTPMIHQSERCYRVDKIHVLLYAPIPQNHLHHHRYHCRYHDWN